MNTAPKIYTKGPSLTVKMHKYIGNKNQSLAGR